MHMDRIALASNGNPYADRNEKASCTALPIKLSAFARLLVSSRAGLARHGLVAENAGREHFAPTRPKSCQTALTATRLCVHLHQEQMEAGKRKG